MATTGLALPTRLRSLRTTSVSIALTSSRRPTALVGTALRSGDLGKNSLKCKDSYGGQLSASATETRHLSNYYNYGIWTVKPIQR